MKFPPQQSIEQPEEMAKRLLSQVINLAKLSANTSYLSSATRQTEYDSPGLAFDKPIPSALPQPSLQHLPSQFQQPPAQK